MPLVKRLFPALLALMFSSAVRAADDAQTWQIETLTNGLRVIYAPMPKSPTVHVRVLYHVGSRDERSDRQGFAHMFEHMMFRGSAHVPPQEHMRLVGLVGGYSNAFTSFDKTVYYETLPASNSEMALWLEADRMSSFKVSPQIFYTERLVVGEEWRMRMNQPYGTMWDELMPAVFKVHPYRWTPIGNMDHLQAATAAELQEFFNKYYVPNNAILVVAGNVDVGKTKEQVHKFFGWIPEGPPPSGIQSTHAATGGVFDLDQPNKVERNIPAEPPQTEPRHVEVTMRVPLPRLVVAYRMPPEASDDNEKLGLLLAILGDGQSSRLSRALVTTDDPLCISADSLDMDLEDGGVMGVMATMLQGKKVEDAEKIIQAQVAEIREKPVTAAELDKVRQQMRMEVAMRFETAEKVATELGDEMLVHGNLDRVPTTMARLEAITPADLLAVAQKYLVDDGATMMIIRPGVPAPPATRTAVTPAVSPLAPPASQPAVTARTVNFPADYPAKPPMSGKIPAATFEKGVEKVVTLPNSKASVRVIVMEDHRMPIVDFSLTLRAGSQMEPAGKEGVAGLTAQMIRRGPKGKTFDQFNEDLESRAINLDVLDGSEVNHSSLDEPRTGGDTTRIIVSSLKDQFPYALDAARQMLLTPAFDPGEFQRLMNQTTDDMRLELITPQAVATRQLAHALYGDTTLGRVATLKTLAATSLDDVKQFYSQIYRVNDAILVISGDISVADAQKAAENFLAGLPTGELPKVDAALPPAPDARHIFLVDLPESKQSAIRIGIPAYSIASDEKFTGSLINQMLSNGIESRLGKYVRAEKGYVYGVTAIFVATPQAGVFAGQTDTKFSTTADTLTAMFKVFDDMKAGTVGDQELSESKSRVAGSLLMTMETISDQASRRIDGILNGYPIDYYDKYASRISQVTAQQIKDVVDKYVDEDKMDIVVVAPAERVQTQLEGIGKVEVIKEGE